jgi:DNA polymerase III epsilon subunit-like protein
MSFCVFDIETDGLLDEVSKIHVLSYAILEKDKEPIKGNLYDYTEIANFISSQDVLVGHNIIRYDIPVLEKILGICLSSKEIIDTLGLSWYMYCEEEKHGLEAWGEHFKVLKPQIDNWKNLTIEEYTHRCNTDVEINTKVFIHLYKAINEIYDNNSTRIIQYLNFKLKCLRDQEKAKIWVDRVKLYKTKQNLSFEIQKKQEIVSNLMPPGKILQKKPKTLIKKDGIITEAGKKWLEIIKANNLPLTTESIREKGNPGSNSQIKEWLFSLGWKPQTFKISKATGEKVPQINLPFGQGLCESIKELYEVEPALQELESYFMLRHRLGIIDGFIECLDKYGYVYSSAKGLTNTLRLRHTSPIVNLPSVDKPYGKEIRGLISVKEDDEILIGMDISGLESATADHYIYFYDPEYVKEKRTPGFDPHIDIARLANMITEEEAEFFKHIEGLSDLEKENISKEDKDRLKSIKKKRHTAKTGNFAMTYNAYPPKIQEICRFETLDEAQHLFDVYWERNKGIRMVVNDTIIKKVKGRLWLWNPVAQLWMYLKTEKDTFSCLNQSTGSYVFNCLLRIVKEKISGKGEILLEYHDEMLIRTTKALKEEVLACLDEAVIILNNQLKLNIEISISKEIGKNYADCH